MDDYERVRRRREAMIVISIFAVPTIALPIMALHFLLVS
jgi:hypothetical protein